MGDNYILECSGCGFSQEVVIGLGLSTFLKIKKRLTEEILSGKYGEKNRQIFIDNPQADLVYGINLYQCEKCGNLLNDFGWGLTYFKPRKDPTDIRTLGEHVDLIKNRKICRKCSGEMKPVLYSNVKCPVCGNLLSARWVLTSD